MNKTIMMDSCTGKKGLMGEIDYDRTSDGIIINQDGFKAITLSYIDFEGIVTVIGHEFSIS